jgi:hypothetical protein
VRVELQTGMLDNYTLTNSKFFIIMERMKNLLGRKIPLWTYPVVLLALGAVSYLPLAPNLGFYWDDWAQLLVARLYDLRYYWSYFTYDRPLSAWTTILYMPLLGGSPLIWHIFTLLLRCATGLAMGWTFSNLWPAARRQMMVATLLFMVYPAFTEQSIVVAYSQHWTQYALFFVSLGAMIQAVRNPRRFRLFTALALLAQLLQFSITEFFFGAELVRPIMLWFLISGAGEPQKSRKLLATLKAWLPYLFVDGAFLVWRFFVYPKLYGDSHPTRLLQSFFSQPLASLSLLFTKIVQDMLYILVTSWSKVLDLSVAQINQPVILLSWAVALVTIIGLTFYFSRLDETDLAGPDAASVAGKVGGSRSWLREALIVGAFVTLLGPAPIWTVGNNIFTPNDVHTDRFALVSMFGVCLLFVAFVEWGMKGRFQKALLVSVVIGLAAGFQIRAASPFRTIWTLEERFYWQLYWRAPYIKPQTMILAQDIFLPQQELFSTTAAINLLYPQPRYPKTLNYSVYTLMPRYSKGFPGNGVYFQTQLRILNYHGSSTSSLLVQFNPAISGCLWVLKPTDVDNPDLPPLTVSALKAAHLNRIVEQPPVKGYPPADLFGKEPEHGWCYIYEKADLADQMGEWQQVVELAGQARQQGLQPAVSPANNPYEWLPFIEGYAMSADWADAQNLTITNSKIDKKYNPMLCDLWNRIETSAPASSDKDLAIKNMSTKLKCTLQPSSFTPSTAPAAGGN